MYPQLLKWYRITWERKRAKGDYLFLPPLWASQLWPLICTPNSILIRKTAPGGQQQPPSSTTSIILEVLRFFSPLWGYSQPKTHGSSCLCFLCIRIIGLHHHARLQMSGFLLHNALEFPNEKSIPLCSSCIGYYGRLASAVSNRLLKSSFNLLHQSRWVSERIATKADTNPWLICVCHRGS